MYPTKVFIVEDIKAISKKHQKEWNKSFSPLEVGKNWFYSELSKLGRIDTIQGYETKALRDELGLKKSKQKLSNKFEAHCVDSWVLANGYTGGHTKPDNRDILYMVPLQFHRRQLHRLRPNKNGVRLHYGGTMSLGLKRGSLVKHKKHNLAYVGGHSNDRISLHTLQDGKRVFQNIKPNDCKFLTYMSWRFYE
jgi:hypothetical protein